MKLFNKVQEIMRKENNQLPLKEEDWIKSDK